MLNPFEELNQKLDTLLLRVDSLDPAKQLGPKRIAFPEFCKMKGISRQTGYAWRNKKLIETERIGGRWYVIALNDDIQKYQREKLLT